MTLHPNYKVKGSIDRVACKSRCELVNWHPAWENMKRDCIHKFVSFIYTSCQGCHGIAVFIKNEPDLTYFSTMVAMDRGVKKHIRFHDDQKGVDDSCRKSKIIMNGWQLSLECMNHALTFRHNMWLQPELMSAPLSSTEFENGDTSSLWKGHMSTKDDFNTDRSETISNLNDLSRGFNMRIVTEVEHC